MLTQLVKNLYETDLSKKWLSRKEIRVILKGEKLFHINEKFSTCLNFPYSLFCLSNIWQEPLIESLTSTLTPSRLQYQRNFLTFKCNSHTI